MKITDIRFGMLRVPLKTPFKTALRSVEQVEDVVVMVHTDSGHVGYGSAPATAVITGDTHGSIVEAVRQYIAPRILGQDIANLNRITGLIQGAMEKNTSAKAAVEIAVHDLWGQLYGAPLYQLLGGGEPAITTDITISVDYIDKMVADSLAAVERGFESLKIKVGKDIGVDIERTKAIHAAVEGRALLRLDANQGWTAKQAVFALQTLEDAGVKLELVEQPVKAHDLEGLRYVTERVHTPVMADESVFGPMEVIELIRLVRTPECDAPLSGLVSETTRWVRRLKVCDLVVSFADATVGHHGGIYQAASWIYHGQRERRMDGVVIGGKFVPGRMANNAYGTRSPAKLNERGIDAVPHYDDGKHLYWRALNRSGRQKAKRLGLLSMPYPKPDAEVLAL